MTKCRESLKEPKLVPGDLPRWAALTISRIPKSWPRRSQTSTVNPGTEAREQTWLHLHSGSVRVHVRGPLTVRDSQVERVDSLHQGAKL